MMTNTTGFGRVPWSSPSAGGAADKILQRRQRIFTNRKGEGADARGGRIGGTCSAPMPDSGAQPLYLRGSQTAAVSDTLAGTVTSAGRGMVGARPLPMPMLPVAPIRSRHSAGGG
jgi:hypothetical protein